MCLVGRLACRVCSPLPRSLFGAAAPAPTPLPPALHLPPCPPTPMPTHPPTYLQSGIDRCIQEDCQAKCSAFVYPNACVADVSGRTTGCPAWPHRWVPCLAAPRGCPAQPHRPRRLRLPCSRMRASARSPPPLRSSPSAPRPTLRAVVCPHCGAVSTVPCPALCVCVFNCAVLGRVVAAGRRWSQAAVRCGPGLRTGWPPGGEQGWMGWAVCPLYTYIHNMYVHV